MLRGLSHVCFKVADLEASIDFYTEKLGLAHAFDFTRADGERFGVYLYFGNRTFLELFKGDGNDPDCNCARSFQHVCMEVASMDEAVSILREVGVEVSDPRMGTDGNPQAWLADPDGNRIELHELGPQGRQLAAITRLEGKKEN